MVLVVLAAVAALGAASATTGSDDTLLLLKTRAEACIRENAPSVERFEPSLSEAASFLMNYICINQISVFHRYKSNSTLLLSMQQQGEGAPSWTLYPPGITNADAQKAIQA